MELQTRIYLQKKLQHSEEANSAVTKQLRRVSFEGQNQEISKNGPRPVFTRSENQLITEEELILADKNNSCVLCNKEEKEKQEKIEKFEKENQSLR